MLHLLPIDQLQVARDVLVRTVQLQVLVEADVRPAADSLLGDVLVAVVHLVVLFLAVGLALERFAHQRDAHVLRLQVVQQLLDDLRPELAVTAAGALHHALDLEDLHFERDREHLGERILFLLVVVGDLVDRALLVEHPLLNALPLDEIEELKHDLDDLVDLLIGHRLFRQCGQDIVREHADGAHQGAAVL